jgi:hypothetical protein
MTELPLPDYYNAHLLKIDEFQKWGVEQLLTGYVIIICDFTFPSQVKYTSIPCYVDKTTTVYPLTGSRF